MEIVESPTTPEPAETTKENKKSNEANKKVSVITTQQYRAWQIEKREKWSEWYRLYFHTVASTICIIFSFLLGYSGMIIYFSHLNHTDGSTVSALSLLMNHPPNWMSSLLGLFFIPVDHLGSSWAFFFITLIPAFTWMYTTVTQPIKKGYRTIISWKSEKGRIIALVLLATSFMGMYCGFMGWYIDTNIFDFFAGIQTPQKFLVVNSMQSFGYILLFSPLFVCAYGVYLTGKEFFQNEDLRKLFFTWEFSPLARQSFNLTDAKCDVIVGWDKKNKKPIVIKETNRMLHEMVVGATGSGKTSTAILIRIVQDLIRIARGQKLGVVVLDPKGDLVQDVLKLARKLGIPESKIKIVDPINLAKSIKFNPLSGPDMSQVAETFRGTLNALSGDQDDFFKGQQEETAAFYVLLGKIFFKDKFDIRHLQQMITDPAYLAEIVQRTRSRIDREINDLSITKEQQFQLATQDGIVRYFEDQVLSFKTFRNNGVEMPLMYPSGHRYEGKQQVESKKDGYITGAKKYINELSMNQLLSQLFIVEEGEETLDLDQFLKDGGILVINTALGSLDEMSLLFGQFFIRQFQSAVFRRPPEEDENGNPTGYKRIPIFFTIDEFPLFINESFERMLTLGRSYRVGTLIAMQSLGQLDSVRPGYDKVVKSNARNKTVFGGGEKDDNEWFSEQFGEEYQIEESLNESTTPITVDNPNWGFRHNTQRSLVARFSPTYIKQLPFKHFIAELIDENNSIQPPIHAIGKFVSETKYLKKFLNVGKGELNSESEKPFTLSSHLNYYKQAVATALKPKRNDSFDSKAVIDKGSAESNKASHDPFTGLSGKLTNTSQDESKPEIESITYSFVTNDEITDASSSEPDSVSKAEADVTSNDMEPADEENYGLYFPEKDGNKQLSESKQHQVEDIRDSIEKGQPSSPSEGTTFTGEHSHMDAQQAETVKEIVENVKELRSEQKEGDEGIKQQESQTTTAVTINDFIGLAGKLNDLLVIDKKEEVRELPESVNIEHNHKEETIAKLKEHTVESTSLQHRHAAKSINTSYQIEPIDL